MRQQFKYNIFEEVAINENALTALFRNFLQFKHFRIAFLQLLGLKYEEAKQVDIENFEIQYNTGTHGIPDMRFFYNSYEFLFEIKVSSYRELTDNQPNNYLEYLQNVSKGKDKRLFLIAPSYYKYEKEFNNRIKASEIKVSEIKIQKISWQEIIKCIEKEEIRQMSPLFAEYYNFLVKWFQTIDYKQLNLDVMYDKAFPQNLEKLTNIIDNLYKEIDGIEDGITKSKLDTDILTEYGFYIEYQDISFYFGIWFQYWIETGKPFVICSLNEDSVFKNACEVNKLKIDEKKVGNWVCCPIPKELIENTENPVEKIKDLLFNMLSEIKKQK